MPDHVINEVLLHNVKLNDCRKVLFNGGGCLSFEVLLPLPLNFWGGDVGTRHREAFPGTRLDVAERIWGTKWDAYGVQPSEDTAGGTLVRFQTAWDHPRGWICALFNTLKCDITASWLSEGDCVGHVETYKSQDAWGTPTWDEVELAEDSAQYLHLYRLLHGNRSRRSRTRMIAPPG